MGGDGANQVLDEAVTGFQSTPPHGGRRLLTLTFTLGNFVSIHAPAWGATRD